MVGGLMQAAPNVYRKYLRNKGATPAGVVCSLSRVIFYKHSNPPDLRYCNRLAFF